MTNQSFRCRKEVVKAYTETNFLDDFVGILGIDVVLNSLSRIFAEILWSDLNKVGDLGL